jgi:uncharacterized membrane protein YhaH (DUF805 family)
MSNATDVWSRKTDDEVVQAVAALDEYTEQGRQAILSEVARRDLDMVRVVATAAPRDVAPTVTQCYLRGWAKFAVYHGRASRREWGTFVIVNFALFATLVMFNLFNAAMLVLLATQLAQLSLSVRRLHDTGRSGWWLLLSLVPFVGWVGVLALLVQNEDPSANQYDEIT